MSEVRLPCETVARYVLPVFRSYLSKELIEKYGYTQVETARKLGTTQAAISQYIHSKRGYKGMEEFEVILPKVQSVASETFSAVAAPVQYAAIRAYQGRLDARNNNDDSVASYLNRYHEDRCTLRNQTNSQQLATLKEACIDTPGNK